MEYLPKWSEAREFKRRFAFEAFHFADVACHGILNRIQKPMDLIDTTFGDNLDSSVSKVFHRSHDGEFLGYLFGMKTESHSLDAAAYKACYSSLDGGVHI